MERVLDFVLICLFLAGCGLAGSGFLKMMGA
jgi:hypothetical protein